MKYDVVIIGGGLSALVCGLKLQRSGKSVLMVSAGQNAMHFSSGSFNFLGKLTDKTIPSELIPATAQLPANHPYSKIGPELLEAYACQTVDFFESAGVKLHGDPLRNSYRLTASGMLKPTWLAMDDVTLFSSPQDFPGGKALIVSPAGFMDFNVPLLCDAFTQRGYSCRSAYVEIEELAMLRKNPTEMRAVNIARLMDKRAVLDKFIAAVRGQFKDEDLVILPQAFGLKDTSALAAIRSRIPTRIQFLGTMIPSVPGIRAQMSLRTAFEAAGGTFLMGDTVVSAKLDSDKVQFVKTSNLSETPLEAEEFVLASGGLCGKGISAFPGKVSEPLFGLDVDFPQSRNEWYNTDFFKEQAFTNFGVITDSAFRGLKDGKVISNLSVIGAECGGARPLEEGAGAGIAIMTAFAAADNILERI